MNRVGTNHHAKQAALSILAHLGEHELDERAQRQPGRDPVDNVRQQVQRHGRRQRKAIHEHLQAPCAAVHRDRHHRLHPIGEGVGLSKIPRLLDTLATRLHIQEDLTAQIADTMTDALDPAGVGVYLTGTHGCMSLRGIKCNGKVTTSTVTGAMTSKRDELFALHLAEL